MTIPKRDKKKRKYNRREDVKAFPAPPVDTMVKSDSDICKRCGRKMLSIRCQCGWVKPINK